MSILERLFNTMDEKNLKSTDLANYLNIRKSTISTWKSRNTNPPLEYTVRICEFLGVTYEYFLTGKCDMKELSNDEKELIEYYRQCSKNRKEKMLNDMKDNAILSKGEAEQAATLEGKLSDYKIG